MGPVGLRGSIRIVLGRLGIETVEAVDANNRISIEMLAEIRRITMTIADENEKAVRTTERDDTMTEKKMDVTGLTSGQDEKKTTIVQGTAEDRPLPPRAPNVPAPVIRNENLRVTIPATTATEFIATRVDDLPTNVEVARTGSRTGDTTKTMRIGIIASLHLVETSRGTLKHRIVVEMTVRSAIGIGIAMIAGMGRDGKMMTDKDIVIVRGARACLHTVHRSITHIESRALSRDGFVSWSCVSSLERSHGELQVWF